MSLSSAATSFPDTQMETPWMSRREVSSIENELANTTSPGVAWFSARFSSVILLSLVRSSAPMEKGSASPNTGPNGLSPVASNWVVAPCRVKLICRVSNSGDATSVVVLM